MWTVACAKHNDEETDINVLVPLEDNFNSEESIPCAAGPLNVGPNTSTQGACLGGKHHVLSKDMMLAQMQTDLVLLSGIPFNNSFSGLRCCNK